MSDKPLDPNLLLEASRVMNAAGKEFARATRMVSDWAVDQMAKATPEIRAGIVGDAAALRLRAPSDYKGALNLLSDIGTAQCPDADGRLHILRALAKGQEYTDRMRRGEMPDKLAFLAAQIQADLATAFATDKTGTGKLKEDNRRYWEKPKSTDANKTQEGDPEDDLKAVYDNDQNFRTWLDSLSEKKPDPAVGKANDPPSVDQKAKPPADGEKPDVAASKDNDPPPADQKAKPPVDGEKPDVAASKDNDPPPADQKAKSPVDGGRMFPDLRAAKFGSTPDAEYKALSKLAAKMVSEFDPPKDGPDGEESGIPALYTYLGKFVDHDLTFGPEGSFQKQKDIDASVDFRSAAFDLDSVYGRGPGDQPYMYAEDGKSLLLGSPLTGGTNANARDLQRNAAGRALIGDPRNDENAIVSQFHGLFLRFHNRVVQENPNLDFVAAQAVVRMHYQYVVVNDFLTRIVSKSVLDELRTNGKYDKAKLKFFTKFDPPFIPVEFATAAYRLGHSMVRPGYRLNDATLLPIFPIPPAPEPGFPEGLTGFRAMIQDWGIDWGRFIDIDTRSYGTMSTTPTDAEKLQNFKRLQFAYRIDTALVDPLGSLPKVVAGNEPFSLALRNLLRSSQFGLPSGQAVAKAMGLSPLTDDKILIGQAVDNATTPLPSIDTVDAEFKDNCPLWTYILAEAIQNKTPPEPTPTLEKTPVSTPQLGPVGGRIVAEVFLGLMFADKLSILSQSPNWTPPGNANYQLKDFVKFALGL